MEVVHTNYIEEFKVTNAHFRLSKKSCSIASLKFLILRASNFKGCDCRIDRSQEIPVVPSFVCRSISLIDEELRALEMIDNAVSQGQ